MYNSAPRFYPTGASIVLALGCLGALAQAFTFTTNTRHPNKLQYIPQQPRQLVSFSNLDPVMSQLSPMPMHLAGNHEEFLPLSSYVQPSHQAPSFSTRPSFSQSQKPQYSQIQGHSRNGFQSTQLAANRAPTRELQPQLYQPQLSTDHQQHQHQLELHQQPLSYQAGSANPQQVQQSKQTSSPASKAAASHNPNGPTIQAANRDFLSSFQIIDTNGRHRDPRDFGLGGSENQPIEPEFERQLRNILDTINQDLENAAFLPIDVNGAQHQLLQQQLNQGVHPIPVQQDQLVPYSNQQVQARDMETRHLQQSQQGQTLGYAFTQPKQIQFQFLKPHRNTQAGVKTQQNQQHHRQEEQQVVSSPAQNLRNLSNRPEAQHSTKQQQAHVEELLEQRPVPVIPEFPSSGQYKNGLVNAVPHQQQSFSFERPSIPTRPTQEPPKASTISLDEQPIEAFEQRPIQQQEHIEQQRQEPIEQQKQEPIEQQRQEPVEQQKQEPIEQLRQEPIEQQRQEPIEQLRQEPIEQQKQEPVEQLRQEPIKQQGYTNIDAQRQVPIVQQKLAQPGSRGYQQNQAPRNQVQQQIPVQQEQGFDDEQPAPLKKVERVEYRIPDSTKSSFPVQQVEQQHITNLEQMAQQYEDSGPQVPVSQQVKSTVKKFDSWTPIVQNQLQFEQKRTESGPVKTQQVPIEQQKDDQSGFGEDIRQISQTKQQHQHQIQQEAQQITEPELERKEIAVKSNPEPVRVAQQQILVANSESSQAEGKTSKFRKSISRLAAGTKSTQLQRERPQKQISVQKEQSFELESQQQEEQQTDKLGQSFESVPQSVQPQPAPPAKTINLTPLTQATKSGTKQAEQVKQQAPVASRKVKVILTDRVQTPMQISKQNQSKASKQQQQQQQVQVLTPARQQNNEAKKSTQSSRSVQKKPAEVAREQQNQQSTQSAIGQQDDFVGPKSEQVKEEAQPVQQIEQSQQDSETPSIPTLSTTIIQNPTSNQVITRGQTIDNVSDQQRQQQQQQTSQEQQLEQQIQDFASSLQASSELEAKPQQQQQQEEIASQQQQDKQTTEEISKDEPVQVKDEQESAKEQQPVVQTDLDSVQKQDELPAVQIQSENIQPEPEHQTKLDINQPKQNPSADQQEQQKVDQQEQLTSELTQEKQPTPASDEGFKTETNTQQQQQTEDKPEQPENIQEQQQLTPEIPQVPQQADIKQTIVEDQPPTTSQRPPSRLSFAQQRPEESIKAQRPQPIGSRANLKTPTKIVKVRTQQQKTGRQSQASRKKVEQTSSSNERVRTTSSRNRQNVSPSRLGSASQLNFENHNSDSYSNHHILNSFNPLQFEPERISSSGKGASYQNSASSRDSDSLDGGN